MNKKEHLSMEGLRKIVSIRGAMYRGLTEVLINSFPGITPEARPLVNLGEFQILIDLLDSQMLRVVFKWLLLNLKTTVWEVKL
jgi:hypothetical protein